MPENAFALRNVVRGSVLSSNNRDEAPAHWRTDREASPNFFANGMQYQFLEVNSFVTERAC
ncbi:hypothetical protein A9X01_02200 [Mycobacterium asiaticum]|uniref:Uncharacterized protein n=1 Tax=Mycobacterium asiaticum TaxID=1790 RepID=A0A1A3BXD8_MYCAS|nr:hypothetical protein A9X01_02200 [Mycobacterium asiaticum]